MTRKRSPILRLENHIVTQKEEEVREGDKEVKEILLEEEEESEEEK